MRVAPHVGIILLLWHIDISRRGFTYERGKKLAKLAPHVGIVCYIFTRVSTCTGSPVAMDLLAAMPVRIDLAPSR